MARSCDAADGNLNLAAPHHDQGNDDLLERLARYGESYCTRGGKGRRKIRRRLWSCFAGRPITMYSAKANGVCRTLTGLVLLSLGYHPAGADPLDLDLAFNG